MDTHNRFNEVTVNEKGPDEWLISIQIKDTQTSRVLTVTRQQLYMIEDIISRIEVTD